MPLIKTLRVVIAIGVTLAAVSVPASAGYVSPSAHWSSKAFLNGCP